MFWGSELERHRVGWGTGGRLGLRGVPSLSSSPCPAGFRSQWDRRAAASMSGLEARSCGFFAWLYAARWEKGARAGGWEAAWGRRMEEQRWGESGKPEFVASIAQKDAAVSPHPRAALSRLSQRFRAHEGLGPGRCRNWL